MPTFIAIGYGDAAGYEKTDPAVRDRAHAHDADLRASGARMWTSGAPVQVRNPEEAGTRHESSAFMTSPLPVAGFTLLEADDLEHAIALVSTTPCAVAHGVVEVWPMNE
ncbi:transcription initiation protein [Microbacterium halotolerans]|uniref:transcription initiation protein n=1 Tax=Microbacterium halotolerans TaxID=246613 RepID=UPI000E6AD9E1|nr:transcription initiation protein [Microbacterium halotolerans]